MKIPDANKHKNPNGTYNGVSYMAELSGLSEEEIRWTANRVKELYAAGHTKATLLPIVKAEAKAKFGKTK